MLLTDAVAGACHIPQPLVWRRSDGTPEDLTGAVLTGVLRPEPSGPARAIVGSLIITVPLAGTFVWTYALADVVAGAYQVQFTATFAQDDARTRVISWQVHPALTLPETPVS